MNKLIKIFTLFILTINTLFAATLMNTEKEQQLLNNQVVQKIQTTLTEEEKEYLKQKRVLKVQNLKTFPPFNFIENETPKGYSIDYMKMMAKYLEIDIEFISGKPWPVYLNMLSEGTLDVIPHIAVNEERKKFITYTDFKHIQYSIGLAVNKNLNITSMKDLKDKSIAVVNKNFLHTHLKKNFPNQKLLAVKTTQDALQELELGHVDAVIGSIASLNFFIDKDWLYNLKTVIVEGIKLPQKVELPMGVTKDNLHLKSILEKVDEQIPYIEKISLKEKWLGAISNSNELSNSEKRFLQEKRVIKFLVRKSRPPFEFEENGKPAGITVDYMRKIAQKSGFEAEFILKEIPFNQSYKMMLQGNSEFDTVGFMVKNDKRAQDFVFGDTFLSYPMMIITHKKAPYIGQISNLINQDVAIEKGFLTNKWLQRDYPDINIIPASGTVDALQKVNEEKVVAYVGNMAVANYMMAHGGLNNIKIAAPSGYGTINYSFVSPKHLPLLSSIMSKGFKQITPAEHNLIQQKWFSHQTIEKINYALIWQILGIAICIILLFIWWNRRLHVERKKVILAQKELEVKNEELERISTTDKLTGLYNRMKIDELFKKQIELYHRYETNFSVILLDVDDFKKINDTYGHNVGDYVLQEISTVLKSCVRNTDEVSRWGGEEFVIICSNIDVNAAFTAAEHIRKKIESVEFETVGKVTISLGVTDFKEEDTYHSMFVRADKNLYQAKHGGKNCSVKS